MLGNHPGGGIAALGAADNLRLLSAAAAERTL